MDREKSAQANGVQFKVGVEHWVAFQVSDGTDICVPFLRNLEDPGVVLQTCHPSPWEAAVSCRSAVSLCAP